MAHQIPSVNAAVTKKFGGKGGRKLWYSFCESKFNWLFDSNSWYLNANWYSVYLFLLMQHGFMESKLMHWSFMFICELDNHSWFSFRIELMQTVFGENLAFCNDPSWLNDLWTSSYYVLNFYWFDYYENLHLQLECRHTSGSFEVNLFSSLNLDEHSHKMKNECVNMLGFF